MAEEVVESPERKFRDNLSDVVAIVEKLAPMAKDADDLVGMLKLALTNDAQLRLLFKEVAPLSMRNY